MRTEQIAAMIAPAIKALGCQLWGLQLVASKRPVLRIFIDTDQGAGIEDCERVSKQVSRILDVEDPFRDQYVLEVSTPGLDRQLFTLEQYGRYAGSTIALKLRLPFEGQRNFTGVLRGVEGDEVVLVVGEEEIFFPIESIEKANVVPQFDEPDNKAGKPKREKPQGSKRKPGNTNQH